MSVNKNDILVQYFDKIWFTKKRDEMDTGVQTVKWVPGWGKNGALGRLLIDV